MQLAAPRLFVFRHGEHIFHGCEPGPAECPKGHSITNVAVHVQTTHHALLKTDSSSMLLPRFHCHGENLWHCKSCWFPRLLYVIVCCLVVHQGALPEVDEQSGFRRAIFIFRSVFWGGPRVRSLATSLYIYMTCCCACSSMYNVP